MIAVREIFGAGGRVPRGVLLRYLLALTAISLAWEFAQMPLYTIGRTGTVGEIVYAALHCTAGDAMIGGFALGAALVAFGSGGWPRQGQVRVLAAAVAIGLGYTVFSEWLNVEVRGAWAYSGLMPVVPVVGTGLSPLAQWVVVPVTAYFWALSKPLGDRDRPVRSTAATAASGGRPPRPCATSAGTCSSR